LINSAFSKYTLRYDPIESFPSVRSNYFLGHFPRTIIYGTIFSDNQFTMNTRLYKNTISHHYL